MSMDVSTRNSTVTDDTGDNTSTTWCTDTAFARFHPRLLAYVADLPRWLRPQPADLDGKSAAADASAKDKPLTMAPPELAYWAQLTGMSALTAGLLLGWGDLPRASLQYTGMLGGHVR